MSSAADTKTPPAAAVAATAVVPVPWTTFAAVVATLPGAFGRRTPDAAGVWRDQYLTVDAAQQQQLVVVTAGGPTDAPADDDANQIVPLVVADPSDGSLLVPTQSQVLRYRRVAGAGAGAAGEYEAKASVVAGQLKPGCVDGHATDAAQFCMPRVCHAVGHEIVVADIANHRVRVIDTAKQTVTTIAGNGKPEHADGAATTAGALMYPVGAVRDPCDADALLVVAGGALRRLQRRTGQLSTVQLSVAGLAPNDVVATPSGWVLFGCTKTNSLYAADPLTGTTHRVAGTGASAGNADGPALRGAAFEDPSALAVVCDPAPSAAAATAAGVADARRVRLIVVDQNNQCVRSLTLPPEVLTPIGGAGGGSGGGGPAAPAAALAATSATPISPAADVALK